MSRLNYKKYIYWNKAPSTNDLFHVHVDLLVGYCPQTIEYFNIMAEELRKTFPQASDKDIEAGRIFQSSYVKGFTIIRWAGYLPKKKSYRGYIDCEQCDYYW